MQATRWCGIVAPKKDRACTGSWLCQTRYSTVIFTTTNLLQGEWSIIENFKNCNYSKTDYSKNVVFLLYFTINTKLFTSNMKSFFKYLFVFWRIVLFVTIILMMIIIMLKIIRVWMIMLIILIISVEFVL